MKELLIELLSEEIPSRMQEAGRVNLRNIITKRLIDEGLTYEVLPHTLHQEGWY